MMYIKGVLKFKKADKQCGWSSWYGPNSTSLLLWFVAVYDNWKF